MPFPLDLIQDKTIHNDKQWKLNKYLILTLDKKEINILALL